MKSLLLVLALLQGRTAPQVMTAVDRDHIGVLEEISFTVRVSSASADPIQVVLQPPSAFELVSRTERSEVNLQGSGERITVVEFRLRANAPGQFHLGPVEVRQGSDIVHGDAVQIRVEPGASVVTTKLSSRVAKLVGWCRCRRHPAKYHQCLPEASDRQDTFDLFAVVAQPIRSTKGSTRQTGCGA